MRAVSLDVIACAFCPSRYPPAEMSVFGNRVVCPSCARSLGDAAERSSTRFQPALRLVNAKSRIENGGSMIAHEPIEKNPMACLSPERAAAGFNWPFVGFWVGYSIVLVALWNWALG